MTAEQKFARAAILLPRLRPFYGALFRVIQKKARPGVETMAVSEDRLYYNPDWVEGLEFPEFLYAALHCVTHIALQHVPRRGGRNAVLWNAAADLFVNKLLAEEFWIEGPGHTARFAGSDGQLAMPGDALFDPGVNTQEDSAESIYLRLAEKAGQTGLWQPPQVGQDSGGEGGGGQGGGRAIDLLDSGADESEKAMRAARVLTDAYMQVEMSGLTAGAANCRLRVIVDDMRKSEAPWRSLLRKLLRESTGRDSSFKRPDKRMLWQSAVYPGQLADGDIKLRDIKLCIDTSGSVSDEDIGRFYGQVEALAREFELNAELIFWDIAIQSRGEMRCIADLHRAQPYGRGGTDPGCLFRYFESRECRVKPLAVIVFTDGYFSEAWAAPRWQKRYKNTIWALTQNHYRAFAPPFGKKAVIRR